MKGSLFTFSFKKTCRGVVLGLLALVLVICVFVRYCSVVNSQRGAMYGFYQFVDDELLDVLCVGSSHIYCSINPVLMYEDYGIAAYNLAAGSQPVTFSYYYLEEAFKTQTPRLVLLDTYMLIADDGEEKERAQMNFLGMRPSATKYRALKMVDGLENRAEIFWQFPITHENYAAINEWSYDFSEESFGLFLGYEFHPDVEPYDLSVIADVSGVTETGFLSEKKETYLRKCIELCQEKGADIALINVPWPDNNADTQKVYNCARQIAEEYGVEFLDGSVDAWAAGLDYTTDSMGNGGHLNYYGAAKYTKWLAEHLLEAGYDLPDRRGDGRYTYWQRESDRFRNLTTQFFGEG